MIMRIVHSLKQKTVEQKEVKNEIPSLLALSNKGDYLWMKGIPESRYEGWFCKLKGDLYKIIEGINVEGSEPVSEIRNNFGYLTRKRGDLEEFFTLSKLSHALAYELNEKRRVEIFFDQRRSYDPGEGCDYDFYIEEGAYIVEFHNGIFLAIDCEEATDIREAMERYYPYDEKRISPPFSKKVQKGVSLYGKRFIFVAGESKKEVLGHIRKVFIREGAEESKRIDIHCAQQSLAGLLVSEETGLYAGIPWFFQFWPRDEAVSLKSLFTVSPKKAREIYFRIIEDTMQKGPAGTMNADAGGWAFKRTEDFLPFFSLSEKEKVRRMLKKCIEECLWSFTEDGLAISRPHETWMDSLRRDGARIEIQAMRLNMYKLAASLAKRRSEKNLYMKMEKEMKEKVRKRFFDGKMLYDGYCPRKKEIDKSIRPNIFIAAYIYPDLLSKEEWKKCFDDALKALWLPWGGLSTLSKDDDDFHEIHTGEDARSYHQGDSWFYLNNLVALVLHRFDSERYAFHIDKIMQASKEELMWKGAIGCHGEVSSSKELKSEGCANQAWSNAMYLEAVEEIEGLS